MAPAAAVAAQCIGYAAGALTTACVVPQIARALRTQSTADISYGFVVTLSLGLVLWTAYGALIGQVPVIVPNAVSLALNLTLIALKLAYDRRRRCCSSAAAAQPPAATTTAATSSSPLPAAVARLELDTHPLAPSKAGDDADVDGLCDRSNLV
jgi:MtN3 and saliva related transmembrane protein